jgi:hypothetical protein
MKQFEYDITQHSADTFDEVVFFCSKGSECALSDVPRNQVEILENILNMRGIEGWELVQIVPGSDGILAFWKRERVSE